MPFSFKATLVLLGLATLLFFGLAIRATYLGWLLSRKQRLSRHQPILAKRWPRKDRTSEWLL